MANYGTASATTSMIGSDVSMASSVCDGSGCRNAAFFNNSNANQMLGQGSFLQVAMPNSPAPMTIMLWLRTPFTVAETGFLRLAESGNRANLAFLSLLRASAHTPAAYMNLPSAWTVPASGSGGMPVICIFP